mmetsp:Transcript_10692/g.43824  ORF Transcript_10692/g.43824 Transcript_10692/m.43824 type:complete len:238 (+) Transcript_10692:921-1634(+)|eukprot:CAMPEP_0114616950 /NCGR_PEP_ID=MMETSP0168-20121206/6948_1 /TAXON_ID=95228 ORGANISM="Vannella sp., Strain DIVA3 517/6/12" /NCGR_SAMPLE_ID=MMETSP0168 /ASSEMBLY_ACC=CAM_ASM_000044 /LENGTH=237 /DNA_ID=CAMNT_0001828075 /DNA_START=143 /DNA_END=856 /DNA_ORIENTATION=+
MADRDWGSKPGSGGVASATRANVDRRERLRQLAIETADLSKDPYFMKNHLGTYECKLCLTLHNNEGNYLAHTQGKKHQTNIARRRARESRDQQLESAGVSSSSLPSSSAPAAQRLPPRRRPKIGLPGYRVTKQRTPGTGQYSLRFEIDYPEIEEGLQPRHRIMSCFEQRVEAPDKNYRYLLFAAEPYETIAFKIPSWEIERDAKAGHALFTNWDRQALRFTMQISFKKQSPPEPPQQ